MPRRAVNVPLIDFLDFDTALFRSNLGRLEKKSQKISLFFSNDVYLPGQEWNGSGRKLRSLVISYVGKKKKAFFVLLQKENVDREKVI
jgi:hypothetical protein